MNSIGPVAALGRHRRVAGYTPYARAEGRLRLRYDRLLWTEGLGRKLREQVQAAFSATPSIKRTPSIS
jgi:hypothetical protein